MKKEKKIWKIEMECIKEHRKYESRKKRRKNQNNVTRGSEIKEPNERWNEKDWKIEIKIIRLIEQRE